MTNHTAAKAPAQDLPADRRCAHKKAERLPAQQLEHRAMAEQI